MVRTSVQIESLTRIDRRKPLPPWGLTYLLCSLIKNPEEGDPPRRSCTKCSEGCPLPLDSELGNIVNRKTPGEGGFPAINSSQLFYLHRSPNHLHKSRINLQKSLYIRKSALFCDWLPFESKCLSSKEPYTSAREPKKTAEEPIHSQKSLILWLAAIWVNVSIYKRTVYICKRARKTRRRADTFAKESYFVTGCRLNQRFYLRRSPVQPQRSPMKSTANWEVILTGSWRLWHEGTGVETAGDCSAQFCGL